MLRHPLYFSDIEVCYAITRGRVTMTTESSKNGATPLSRVNFSVYVGYATVFS